MDPRCPMNLVRPRLALLPFAPNHPFYPFHPFHPPAFQEAKKDRPEGRPVETGGGRPQRRKSSSW